MALAVANYHDLYNSFPPAYVADANGRPVHSWRVLLLPFLEQRNLYEQYNFSEPWNSVNNLKLVKQRPNVFGLHGGNNEGSHTNYLAVWGADTVWPFDKCRTFDSISDGSSNTLSIVENVGSGILWTEPRDLNLATMNLSLAGSPPDGISSWLDPPAVVTADGSVMKLDMKMTESDLKGMLVINDGKGVPNLAEQIPDGRDRPARAVPDAE